MSVSVRRRRRVTRDVRRGCSGAVRVRLRVRVRMNGEWRVVTVTVTVKGEG